MGKIIYCKWRTERMHEKQHWLQVCIFVWSFVASLFLSIEQMQNFWRLSANFSDLHSAVGDFPLQESEIANQTRIAICCLHFLKQQVTEKGKVDPCFCSKHQKKHKICVHSDLQQRRIYFANQT